ncbi:MAG: hypothetical protein Q8P58_01165 [Candidatus Adlerbacteria bacterium]|nr:hypothetical protein [Candidatus Adlerbacteria bacterium]
MSPLFGKKKDDGRTILILDVESGSIGGALVRFSPGQQPKVFGETRHPLPLRATYEPQILADLALREVEQVLRRVAEVAARVRGHQTLSLVGEVGRVVVFLSPPWGALSITNRILDPHPFIARLRQSLEAFFGPVLLTFQPFGLAAAHTTPTIFPSDGHYLLSAISGEVTELILLENEKTNLKIVAHATIPFGHHYPLRTLLSHGNISLAEAHSALRLGTLNTPSHALEALHAAGKEVAGEFASVAGELLLHTPARKVIVVAQEPMGEWFARTLAGAGELTKLFPDTGEVRAMRAGNVTPFMAVHTRRPDLPLLLEALFLDSEVRE